ncbi:MAG TPA: aspartate-semialdehyde dehydrogenase, partial [Chthonomonadales bacterium]|nr:aspartate-semialdehyde dehydrogenase [Chthonomonadales bacterium]
MKSYRVAIVGATGAVGSEFLQLLESREFPLEWVRLLASERSAGRQLPFRGKAHNVYPLGSEAFDKVDIAFFA